MKRQRDVVRNFLCCALLTVGISTLDSTAVAHAHKHKSIQETNQKDTYIISPGDSLAITILNHPEFSINAKVLPDGTFAYPFLGVIQAQGLTREQLRKTISDKLVSSKQLVRPVVTVNVVGTEVKEVIVSGTIRGGKVVLKDGDRILDALSAVGGLGTDRYEFFNAELFRDSKIVALDLSKIYANDPVFNMLLKANDQIIVVAKAKNAIAVTVIGQIANGHGGSVELPRDKSIVSVLNDLGGVSELASLKNATILRGDKSIPIDLRGYRKGRIEKDFLLEAGDIINIPRNEARFKINGMVDAKGEQLYPEDRTLSLFDALTLAKIPSMGADLKKVRLTRIDKGVVTTKIFDVDKMLKGDRSQDIALIPDDEIFVPAVNINKQRISPMEILNGLGGLAGILFALRNIR